MAQLTELELLEYIDPSRLDYTEYKRQVNVDE